MEYRVNEIMEYQVKFVYLDDDEFEPEANYFVVTAESEEEAVRKCKDSFCPIAILEVVAYTALHIRRGEVR